MKLFFLNRNILYKKCYISNLSFFLKKLKYKFIIYYLQMIKSSSTTIIDIEFILNIPDFIINYKNQNYNK